MAAQSNETFQGFNEALIIGELSSEPVLRTLPTGTTVVSFSLRVKGGAGDRATSVPLAWYDPPKRWTKWKQGEIVVAAGAVTRRFFQGAGGLGSATEVVVRAATLARFTERATKVAADSRRRPLPGV